MSDALYRRTAHCCRTCLGPVLQGEAGFICAICDTVGAAAEEICGCGIKQAGQSGKNLGFRCAPNPARGQNSPAAVVIVFGESFNIQRPA